MIQRIQTIYFTIAALFAGMFSFFSDFAIRSLNSRGVQELSSSGLAIISGILAFTTIFFFKKRRIQLTLIGLNSIMLMITLVLFVFSEGISEFYKDWPFYLLIVSVVALFLARKGVKADEELIRSADRLR